VLGRRLSTSQGVRPTKRVGVATTVMRCRSCGLVFSNPLPVPNDLGDHYDIDPGDYWKPGYFDETDLGPLAATFHSLWAVTGPPSRSMSALGSARGCSNCSRTALTPTASSPPRHFTGRPSSGSTPERLSLASVEEADYSADVRPRDVRRGA
jgi:hypothetical protein